MTTERWPIGVRLLDIGEPIRAMDDVLDFPRVRVFVADHGTLIGSFDVWNGRHRISADRLRQELVANLGYVLAQRSVAAALGGGTAAAPRGSLPPEVSVSVVVPTAGRVDDLRRCVASLLAQRTPRRLEVVVVDNRPGYRDTPGVVREFPGVVLVTERRPGLSFARNAGFRAASGDILVATDDDVVAPPDWIERLVAPFARPEVAVVTGNVLPLELDTRSQCEFEAYGGLGKGFQPLEVDGGWFRQKRGAVPTWQLGATANAAFRASVLADPAVGLLDEALGAGMPTGCSEDTYAFYRILKRGGTIVYEPSAYVWHRHRRSDDAFRSQIYAYSKGHVAYHLTTLLRDRDPRALVRLAWSLPKTYAQRALARLRGHSDYPLYLLLVEVAGNLAGPFALWRSRARVKRLGAGTPFLIRARAPQPAPAAETSHALPLESPLTQNPAS